MKIKKTILFNNCRYWFCGKSTGFLQVMLASFFVSAFTMACDHLILRQRK